MVEVIVSIIISIAVRFVRIFEGFISFPKSMVMRAASIRVWIVTFPLIAIIVRVVITSDFSFIEVPLVIFIKWVIVMIFVIACFITPLL
tara:strand:- start:519 stop:785 length:267 start_codon:yes stop_codon:yes gene_type:complete